MSERLARTITTNLARQAVQAFLAERYPHPFTVLLVVPPPGVPYRPWLDVMVTEEPSKGLFDELENTYPDVVMNFVWTEADHLYPSQAREESGPTTH